jgi:putative glutamine amidotransferase
VKPLIGVSTYREQAAWGAWPHQPAALVPQGYVDGVVAAGGQPVLLPPAGGEAEAGAVLARLDGLLLIGGPDLDPERYGQPPHPRTTPARTERDGWEAALAHAALELDLPVLGVCRGAQLLNVVLGGTLHQHLPETVGHEVHCPARAVFGHNTIIRRSSPDAPWVCRSAGRATTIRRSPNRDGVWW